MELPHFGAHPSPFVWDFTGLFDKSQLYFQENMFNIRAYGQSSLLICELNSL